VIVLSKNKEEFMEEGYNIGQKPPGLAEDGSFDAPITGIRVHCFVGDGGEILVVDKTTGLLIEQVEDDFGEDEDDSN
jgi:hypothetical protein